MEPIKEYRAAVLKECTRIVGCMSKEYPATENYRSMAMVLSDLTRAAYAMEPYPPFRETPQVLVEKAEEPAPPVSEEEEAAPSFRPVTPEQPVQPEPVGGDGVAVLNEKKEYTKEEIRSLLEETAAKGVVIMPILQKYIPEGKPVKFPSIKASDYPALAEDLKNAI